MVCSFHHPLFTQHSDYFVFQFHYFISYSNMEKSWLKTIFEVFNAYSIWKRKDAPSLEHWWMLVTKVKLSIYSIWFCGKEVWESTMDMFTLKTLILVCDSNMLSESFVMISLFFFISPLSIRNASANSILTKPNHHQ
jgi:sensor histidine kinase YesM